MSWREISKYRGQIYGITMIWIVIFHLYEACTDAFPDKWLSSVIFNNGNLGVDIFLFLSGVSMSYAMARYSEINGKTVQDFYRRRFRRVLQVYILFCVPSIFVRYYLIRKDLSLTIRQLLFCDKRVSSYWFVAIIMICYLIYPAVEMMLRKKKQRLLVLILFAYMAAVVGWCLWGYETFVQYEILSCRIPIFVMGALCADKVKNGAEMTRGELSFFLAGLLLWEPCRGLFSNTESLASVSVIARRLMMGWVGLGCIVLMILILRLYEGGGLDRFLSYIGQRTLEIYVFHVFLRAMCLIVLHRLGMSEHVRRDAILLGCVFIPLSIFGGCMLADLLNRITVRKNGGKTNV